MPLIGRTRQGVSLTRRRAGEGTFRYSIIYLFMPCSVRLAIDHV